MATSVILSAESESLVLSETLATLPDVRIECERVVKSGEESIMPLLWTRGADHETLTEAFEEDADVEGVELLTSFENEHLYQMEWVGRIELLLQMLTNGEATILDAYARHDEWKLRVLYPTRDHLSSTHEFCEDHGMSLEIEAIREMEGEPTGRYGLTEGQYEALVAAVQAGHYDVPQETTMEELAAEMDVTHQALSERLRRGTKALVQDTLFIGNPPESAN